MPPRSAPSLILLLFAACPSACLAQANGPTRWQHPWGRFQPGAWKLVRVVTETFDGQAAMSSVSETRTTVREVGVDSVTLMVEVAVQLGGKEFGAEPQMIRQGFHGETATPDLTTKDLGLGEVTIEKQNLKIPCRIEQLEYHSAAGKTVTRIYYSDSVEPYVLRRETTRVNPGSTAPAAQTIVRVVDLDVPYQVLNTRLHTAKIEAVHKDAAATTTTISLNSMQVPGGVVCHNSKVVDNQGRLIGCSTLELIDYGLTPDDHHGGLFPRLRAGHPLRLFRFPSRE